MPLVFSIQILYALLIILYYIHLLYATCTWIKKEENILKFKYWKVLIKNLCSITRHWFVILLMHYKSNTGSNKRYRHAHGMQWSRLRLKHKELCNGSPSEASSLHKVNIVSCNPLMMFVSFCNATQAIKQKDDCSEDGMKAFRKPFVKHSVYSSLHPASSKYYMKWEII